MILNFYIEVNSENDRNNLESILYSNRISFYDATNFDPYTAPNSSRKLNDLLYIEAELELK